MKRMIAGLLLIVCFLTACSAEPKPQVVTQVQESEESAVSTPAEAASISVEKTEATSTEPTEESTVETSAAPTELSEPTREPATEPITEQVTETPATTQPPTTKATTEPTEPTEPSEPTEPTQTQAPVTEPEYEAIDISALEAYGRSYAETLGYDGDPNTGFATNAGYFPPSWMKIRSMEEGYQRVKELVDAQYADDLGAGHAIVVVIDGVERHRKLNIYIEPTDEANVFLIYCFYGGE